MNYVKRKIRLFCVGFRIMLFIIKLGFRLGFQTFKFFIIDKKKVLDENGLKHGKAE